MGKVYVTWIGCVLDGADHAVAQAEVAAGVRRRTGHYRAICGHALTAASMLQPPGTPCPACQVILRVAAPEPDDRHAVRGNRSSGRLRRWLACFGAPVGTGDAASAPVSAGSRNGAGGS